MAPSTRKSQARIVFTPIPSSDPAAQGYNKQIQDRAAAVSYGDLSSQQASKRRKLQPTATSQSTLASTMLPTPAEDLADAPSGSTQRKSKRRAKQQRLDFGPSSGTVNLDPPTGPNMFTKQRGQKRAAEFSSDSDELPSTAKLGRSKKSKAESKKQKTGEVGFMDLGGKKVKKESRKQKEATPVESEEEEDEIVVKSAGKSRREPTPEEDPEDEIVVMSARKAQPKSTPQEEEEDDEDEVVLPSARKARRPPQQVAEDDSEDELPVMGTQKRRRVERQSSVLSSSPPAATAGSEDDLQIIEDPKRTTRSQKRPNPPLEAEDDEEMSEEDEVAPRTPGRRLQRRGRRMTQQEKEDLDEDMDFIGPSSDVDDDRGPRDSQTLKKNARLQALERLKQVRSSQKTGLPDIQEDAEDDADAVNQQELDELYDNSDESPEPAPTSSRAMFAADEYDEDFIEEGDDDTLGVPDGIPLAFTRYASMKAKDLWKFAIEWLVQKKINPAFAMDDEIYTLTFQKLDDEVSGLVGSKFASSAWTGDFTIALRSRPEIAYNSIDRNTAEHAYRDKCDACNRSGHPATREVQFQGKPYNRQTLDEVARNDSDSDDDDEDSGNSSDSLGSTASDRPAYDASGRQVPPANKTWYVGKFCMGNARTAHALHHWRYHLYEWVVIWIDGNGYSSVKELKKRDKMSTKKRRKYANKIVDRMVEEGVVKKLWKEFRGTIDDAVNAKQGRYEVGSP
jgi:hypothetical protein